MPIERQELDNSAISILCEIGESSPVSASEDRRTHIGELIARGYVELDPKPGLHGERYKLTAKALKFLGERGAGLNEA